MSNLAGDTGSGSSPLDPRETRQLIDRIEASKHFKRSRRLRGFLVYICDRALSGKGDEINEHLIGERVFGRRHGYDTGVDNIVRVEARELRQRLAAYFEDEGAFEPVVIRVPKGGYTPVFEARGGTPSPPRADADSNPGRTPLPGPGQPGRLVMALGALSAVLAISTVYLLLGTSRGPGTPATTETPLRTFWSSIFDSGIPTIFCVADSNYALLQDLRNESGSFEDYQSGKYFAGHLRSDSDDPTDKLLATIATRHHTGLADVSIISRLLWLSQPPTQLMVRSARDLNVADFRGQNAIITGSSRSNPWASLFDGQRNFTIGYEESRARPVVVNKEPRPGEQKFYRADPVGEGVYGAFGTVAFLPNLDRSGHVVLIAGTNMQGTDAAADLLTSPERFEELRSALGVTGREPLPEFEAVMKLATVGGSSISTELIATRRIADNEEF